ncbi:MAG: phosphate/phosphite/phosphonate ABC transporter substrate-binding protein [Armatimonadota bacterium]|nr:phosphate/phosphite/phosphonate ABC transporter substrate-binding protein [Armatimonadota bacterium]
MRNRFAYLAALVAALVIAAGCGRGKSAIGTPGNPIRMAVVPSVEQQKLAVSGEQLGKMLEKQTGYSIRVSVPTSYAAVVEAMGANQVDVGWLPPFAYVLANQKSGVDVILKSIRGGSASYNGLIITRADSGIKSLDDLKGKRFAYVDALSTSGCIYPKILLVKKGYDPDKFFGQTVFAGSHDAVIAAVYNKQVDAGAIYGGPISDARERMLRTLPDLMSKTRVIARTDPIPNDTVSVRKGLPPDVTLKIKEGLLAVARSEEGRKTVLSLYGIDDLTPAKDSDYDSVRHAVRALKLDISEAVKKG